MQRLFRMLELVSENDTTVLLEGESGTGKELFAKAIHSLSHRKKFPMITVNCGAIPDTLIENQRDQSGLQRDSIERPISQKPCRGGNGARRLRLYFSPYEKWETLKLIRNILAKKKDEPPKKNRPETGRVLRRTSA